MSNEEGKATTTAGVGAMDGQPRDVDDVMLRHQLTHVANLRDLLHAVVPDLADGFTFDEATLVPPGHFLPDWRQRESNISCKPWPGRAEV